MSTINLLPEDCLRRRARKRANVLCMVLFGLVMAGVLGAGVVTDQHSRNTRRVCDQVNASYEDAARLIDQMQRLQEQKAVLLAKAEQASALQERVPRSYVLGTLANACPERASLTSVQMLSKAADPNHVSKFAAVAGQRSGKIPPIFVDMVVTGQAQTNVEVAQFITNLSRNPLLTNVDIVYTEERASSEKGLYQEFQVRMEVRAGIDVLDVIGPANKSARANLARRADLALGPAESGSAALRPAFGSEAQARREDSGSKTSGSAAAHLRGTETP
jgi:Tfp pilus assembly protein PilN